MQKDIHQTQVKEPRDDAGGYASLQHPQQPAGFYNRGEDGQGNGNQRYEQPDLRIPKQQRQYWQQQLYGTLPPCVVGPYELTSLGLRTRTVAWLSYLLGWVTGLIFFLLEKESRFVRFHAMQSILFFGGLSVLEVIIWIMETYSLIPIFGFGVISGVIGLAGFVCWIVLMVRASKGVYYKLPVIGNYADKLIDKIRL